MVDFSSLLDRSRDALFAVAGQAASVVQDTGNGQRQAAHAQDESLLAALLPRGFASAGDVNGNMDLDFVFHDAPARVADWRNVMLWIVALMVCVVIAASTNPNETSFRSYLTELSFRRHLVDIRSDDHASSNPDAPGSASHDDPAKGDSSTIVTPSPSLAVSTQHHGSASGTDTPIAPFRFANHVSISLRTPTLYYKTLYVLSVALTSPLGPPAFLSDPITLVRNRGGPVQKERLVLYVGYLGHWVQLGIVPRRLEWIWRMWFEAGKEKRKKADRAGVMDMRAVQAKDDTATRSNTLAPPSKNVRRIGSNSDLSANSHPSPLPLPSYAADSRRASVVSIPLPSDTADTSPAVIALKADLSKAQDALTELKNQLLSHEQSVSDAHASLQATLDDLRTKRKEDDADRSEIKSKTKALEEQKRQAEAGKRDAEKKLKAAESARDVILGKIEGAKKDMADAKAQIEASERAARTLTEEGARFVVETQESVESRKKELGDVENETRVLEEEVEALSEKVKEAEEKLKTTQSKGYMAAPPQPATDMSPTAANGAAATGSASAQSAAAAAVANAIVGKNLAPEEEMMMMAAAYEVAAQEGYHAHGHHSTGHGHALHGHTSGPGQGHGSHSHSHHGLSSGYNAHHAALGHGLGNNSWASQAAAYMAEAGMPSLDQNYTARPTYHGRQISGTTSSSTAAGLALGAGAESKRLTELMAFDDFGPGSGAGTTHDAHGRDKRLSGEGFGQVLGLAANRLSAQAQAHAEEDEVSEAELYGLDPASPNGGISTSFSANLLGQGLFNSLLGGDQTPVDGTTDDGMDTDDGEGKGYDEGTTLEEALNFGPAEVLVARGQLAEEEGDSDEESGDENGEGEHGAQVRSPVSSSESRAPFAAVSSPDAPGQPHQTKTKRFSFSRLVPPSTSPLNPARVPSAAPSNTSSTGAAAVHSNHAPTPPALPGLPSLPALPGSRRWFSGTMSASAENLQSFPYHSSHGLAQSSDSLASHSHTHILPGSSNLAPGAGGNASGAAPGSGASTTAGSLYESSPFAPSESERKKLMGLGGMWGQMGMGGIGKRFSAGASHAQSQAMHGQGHGQEEGLGRSTSLDLAPHSRGQSAPSHPRSFSPSPANATSGQGAAALAGTSPQSQQSWMARHLHLQSSGLGNGALGSSHAHSGSVDSTSSQTQGIPIAGTGTNVSSASGGMRSFFGSSPGSATTKLGSSPSAGFGALGTSPSGSHRFSDALQAIAGDSPAHAYEDTEGDKKDKEKGFNKLFSFRKPSAAKLGSSPGAQSTGSAASTSDKA